MYLNYYAIPLVILVFILSSLLSHIRRYKDAAGSTCFSLLLAATIIYSSFYALEISSDTYYMALTFYKLEYIGVPFIPAFFLTFSMRYTGKKKWLNAPTLVSIFSIPLITMILVLTTGGHTLYHKEILFSTETIFPTLVYEPGPWYIIQEFYNILCIMLGQVLLLNTWFEVQPAFRKQISIVMTGAAMPFLVLLLYLSGIFPTGFDPIPYSLTFCGLVIYLGLTRYNLLDIAPLARSTLFGKLPEGVIVLDDMKRIVDINDTAEYTLGITDGDIGKNATEVLISWPELISAGDNGKAGETNSLEIKKNVRNEELWFKLVILPLSIENEDMLGQMIIICDITKTKNAEEKLLRTNRNLEIANEHAKMMTDKAETANRAKTEFLANISHEIRTPLNGIIGFSDLLLESELTESQRCYTNTVYTSANTLLGLMNNVIDYSRIEAGKLELDTEKTEPFYLINHIVDNIKFKAQEKNLDLKLSISKMPKYIFVDQIRLKQVLINLLDNAVKFTEEGEIELKVEATETADIPDKMEFTFSVKDTGIGIAEENKRKIFESFSQEDGSITRKYGGAGLGLTISSRLLELMDSKLELEGEPGKGSRFYFSLKLPVEKKDTEIKKEEMNLVAY